MKSLHAIPLFFFLFGCLFLLFKNNKMKMLSIKFYFSNRIFRKLSYTQRISKKKKKKERLHFFLHYGTTTQKLGLNESKEREG